MQHLSRISQRFWRKIDGDASWIELEKPQNVGFIRSFDPNS